MAMVSWWNTCVSIEIKRSSLCAWNATMSRNIIKWPIIWTYADVSIFYALVSGRLVNFPNWASLTLLQIGVVVGVVTWASWRSCCVLWNCYICSITCYYTLLKNVIKSGSIWTCYTFAHCWIKIATCSTWLALTCCFIENKICFTSNTCSLRFIKECITRAQFTFLWVYII